MDNKTFYPDTDDENFQSKIFSSVSFITIKFLIEKN